MNMHSTIERPSRRIRQAELLRDFLREFYRDDGMLELVVTWDMVREAVFDAVRLAELEFPR